MQSFIIHMPGARSRMDNVARLMIDLPHAKVVPAVDGRDPDQISGVDVLPGTLHHPPIRFR